MLVYCTLSCRVSKSQKAAGYGECEGDQLLTLLLEQVQQLKQLRNKLSEQHQEVLRLSPLQHRSPGALAIHIQLFSLRDCFTVKVVPVMGWSELGNVG